MTNETRRRINHFRKQLPLMRERVTAAFFALLIAAITTAGASYAWVVLSQSPTVSCVATTLAANGSLEIALASGDSTTLPSDADIDESTTISTDVTVTNLQWGNLINISDSSYGIDSLTLRPAQLNTASLASSPLWGAAYGADGRITQLDSKFTYTKWNAESKEFLASSDNGVRAIASYKLATSSATSTEYDNMYQAVLNAHTAVNTYYQNNVQTQIGTLGSVVGNYLQSKLNGKGYGTSTNTNIAISTADVQSLLNLYERLNDAMTLEKEALVELANLQQYIYAKGNDGVTYSEVTWDTIAANQNKYDTTGSAHKTSATSPDEAIAIKGLKSFLTNCGYVTSDIATLTELVEKSNSGVQIYTDDIAVPVSHICDSSNVMIDGQSVSYYLGDLTAAANLISGHHLVQICGGVLQNFEQMAVDSSYRLPADKSSSTTSNAATIKATAKKGISITINMTGHLYTNASGNSYFMDDFGQISTSIDAGDKIAEDTYGMVVDFWIRSNAESTYLLLEGATTIDTDGSIVSYDGVNRVWGATGNVALTTDSTTQGGGSCYTYYADTPEDMSRSLDLLRSMKVAFVSQDGTLLATASMDTDNYYAVNGRVVVPLAISQSESESYTYTDTYGEELTGYAIKRMELDEATLISAVIYLDGATLTNTQVLAAGNIEGQLNLQFGTSDAMTTVGDNTLLQAERTITASVDNTTFEYDERDTTPMTSTVTLTVDGEQPETITGFFVRAVNSTQGTRETQMTFEKQADGTWTASYEFTLPGEYYLRHVRVNRVDYALEDPPKVTVNGFALSSVEWSEGVSSEKTFFSTDGSYNESVYIAFQSTDDSRTPDTVQARFIRDDGNAVTIDTKYNASTGKWEGTGTFTASGTYTLSYLVLNGNYYDCSSYKKTLTLYIGLTATVYNNASPLTENFDTTDANKVYNRNLQVKIIDNSGNALEGQEYARLYYSNGGSATNGVNSDLTWNEETGYYDATLPITKAGRYTFSSISIGNNILTKVSESPTYIVMSPDAPEYNIASVSQFGSDVQYVPLTNNAIMGPIRISNSAAAQISAVVYNSATDTYYDIVSATTQNTAGTMYYVSSDGGYWIINLPTYEDADGNTCQDGTWQLVALQLWDCYDSETTYRSDSSKLTWLGTDSVASKYASESGISADSKLDYSALTTTVSGTVNISMTAGTTELGSPSAAFMTKYKVSDLGITVAITDNAGRSIPSSKISSVELDVSYGGNTDAETYGYAVSTAANKSYTLTLTQSASGAWEISGDTVWQYVGEYTVTGLKVTVSGTEKTISAGSNGVPEKYTVKSAAPTANDLTVTKLTQNQTTFGKDDSGTVTSAFLAAHSPSVSVELTWASDKRDADGNQYAQVSGLSLEVSYVYQNGNTAPNGGYSWTGDTGYEGFTAAGDDGISNGATYTFSASLTNQVLLAGTYSVTGTLKWTENGTDQSKSVGTLSNISVYSVTPEVKVTGVSPSGDVTVNANGDGSNSYLVSNASPFTASNRFGDYYAVAFMEYEAYTADNNVATDGNGHYSTDYSGLYAHYIAPTVTLETSGTNGKTFSLTVPANGSNVPAQTLSFSGNASQTITIGRVVSNNQKQTEVYDYRNVGSNRTAEFTYSAENAYVLGTKTITTLTTTVGSATYTVTLDNPVIISQTSVQSPKLTYTAPDGLKISVVQDADNMGVTSGGGVAGFTALTVTVTAEDGYYNPRLVTPSNAMGWTVVSEEETKAVYTFTMPYENVNLSGSATAYPTLSFTADNTYAAVTAADSSGNAITSGSKVKTGSTVTVTATAKSDSGYYAPRISTRDGWTVSEGDYVSTYTFTMGESNVVIPAPSASTMAQLNWSDDAALTFTAVDKTESNKSLSAGGYVIPGHEVVVTLVANGGYDPELTSPNYATLTSSGDAFTHQYTFTMPSSAVTLAGTAKAYPTVQFKSDKASVTSFINAGATIDVGNADAKGVRPGNKVSITITAAEGYYAPRINSAPSNVSDWTKVSESNASATYTFTMPESSSGVALNITASVAPTVTISGSNSTVTISGTNYDGEKLTGNKVQPGTVVTVSTAVADGYYSPTVSASGASLSARTGDYDNATYTFTMGTSNVTLTGSATQDPTVKATDTTNGGVTTTFKVDGATVTRAHPGKTVTVTATAGEKYYNPVVSVTGGNVSLTQTNGSATYTSEVTYTFTMGTNNVTMSATASKKAHITYTNVTDNVTYTVKDTTSGATLGDDAYILPGHSISVSVEPGSNYYISQTPTAPSDVTSWSKVSLDYDLASYTFTTNEGSEVNLNNNFTVVDNPTVTVSRVNHAITSRGENYYVNKVSCTGSADILASGESGSVQIRPGTNVTITAKLISKTATTYTGDRTWSNPSGTTYYYYITVSGAPSDATTTLDPAGTKPTSAQSAEITFVMGTDNLSITLDAAQG